MLYEGVLETELIIFQLNKNNPSHCSQQQDQSRQRVETFPHNTNQTQDNVNVLLISFSVRAMRAFKPSFDNVYISH